MMIDPQWLHNYYIVGVWAEKRGYWSGSDQEQLYRVHPPDGSLQTQRAAASAVPGFQSRPADRYPVTLALPLQSEWVPSVNIWSTSPHQRTWPQAEHSLCRYIQCSYTCTVWLEILAVLDQVLKIAFSYFTLCRLFLSACFKNDGAKYSLLSFLLGTTIILPLCVWPQESTRMTTTPYLCSGK